jgi:hypothetical protein
MLRRTLLPCLACLALIQACGTPSTGGDAGADRPGATTTSAARGAGGSTSTTRKGSAPSPTAPRTTAGAGSPSSTSPAGVRPSATTVAGDGGATGPPGAYARTILRPSSSNTIALDLIGQGGASLRATTTDHATSVLRRESSKTVNLARGNDIASNDQSWSPDEIVSAAEANAGARGSVDRPVVHVLALRGGLENDSNAIGVAVRGDVLAVFVDHVADASTPLVPQRVIEDAVTIHELGHVLGLVDLALNRNRADPEHPGHSTNRGSVMYWAIDSDLVTQILDGPPPTDFDQEDRADLATLRSGG